MFNKPFFLEQVTKVLFGGKMKSSQLNGLTTILDEWEINYSINDDRWLAYMFATVHHETDRKMQPVEEYGRGKGMKYGIIDPITNQTYYGRGFVQLTWKANYETLGKVCKVDLVNNPALALEIDISTIILFKGMMNGLFTGKKLSNYFNPTTEDWVNARKIINGLDKAELIADYAKLYYSALSHTV